jgi:two-component system, OmpR family, response regulator
MASTSMTSDERSEPPIERDADLVFEVRDVYQLVAEFDGRLTPLLERMPLTTLQRRDFKQAVLEMGANALEWGRAKGQKPWARVTCRIGPDAVTAIVQDRGPGFDHRLCDQLAEVFAHLDDPSRSLKLADKLADVVGHRWGVGILLAKGLSDDFYYNDRGNEVTLVKRLGPDSIA